MRIRLTLLAAAISLAACHRAPAPPDEAAPSRTATASDTSFLRLCASPPETTATGNVGCVMKDQSRRIPVRKDPPR